MPDRFDYDWLGEGANGLRCIWCGQKAPTWQDESKLESHYRKHQKDREQAAQKSLEERRIASL